jgi:hypothetical protein
MSEWSLTSVWASSTYSVIAFQAVGRRWQYRERLKVRASTRATAERADLYAERIYTRDCSFALSIGGCKGSFR